jgi:purine-binding chemotaxis protein CheW
MNLRGDILTLVDIRPALRMALAQPGPKSKVIVLDIPDLHAGIVADEVIDVIAIAPDSITAVPAAVQAPVDEYLRGVASHDDRVISILDLAAIFERGELEENSEV